MAEVVINTCYGGFGLSNEAIRLYLTRKGILYEERKDKWGHSMFSSPGKEDWSLYDEVSRPVRHDPDLVSVVKELGLGANGDCADLRIVELDEGTLYRIDEYDGMERIETRDSIGWAVAGK